MTSGPAGGRRAAGRAGRCPAGDALKPAPVAGGIAASEFA